MLDEKDWRLVVQRSEKGGKQALWLSFCRKYRVIVLVASPGKYSQDGAVGK